MSLRRPFITKPSTAPAGALDLPPYFTKRDELATRAEQHRAALPIAEAEVETALRSGDMPAWKAKRDDAEARHAMLTRAEADLATSDRESFARSVSVLLGRIHALRGEVVAALRAGVIARIRPHLPGVSDKTLADTADESGTVANERSRHRTTLPDPHTQDARVYFATATGHAAVIAELHATAARLDLARAYAADTSAPLPAAELAALDNSPRNATKRVDWSHVPPPSRSDLIAEGANLRALDRGHKHSPNVRHAPLAERLDAVNAKLRAHGYPAATAEELETVATAMLTSAGHLAAA